MGNVVAGRFGWKNALTEKPPRDAARLVVLVQLTCECGKGGQMVLAAARINGEWLLSPCEHHFEIDYWARLWDYPPPLKRSEAPHA